MNEKAKDPGSVYLGQPLPEPATDGAPAAAPAQPKNPSAVRGFYERARERMSGRLDDDRKGISLDPGEDNE